MHIEQPSLFTTPLVVSLLCTPLFPTAFFIRLVNKTLAWGLAKTRKHWKIILPSA